MNKQNIKTWEADGELYAEWSDRALDDGERYAPDSIILTVSVPIEKGEKYLMGAMAQRFDLWINETRR